MSDLSEPGDEYDALVKMICEKLICLQWPADFDDIQEPLVKTGSYFEERQDKSWLMELEWLQRHVFTPLRGFHSGSLDLEGRHPDRYERINRLLGKAMQILGDVPKIHERIAGAASRCDMKALVEIYDAVPDWLRDAKKNEIFNQELSALRDVMWRVPQPVFQRRSFSDLPLEILHMVLWQCHVHAARRLSAVSRVLHRVSTPYAWSECAINFPSLHREYSDECKKCARGFFSKSERLFRSQEILHNLRKLDISLASIHLQDPPGPHISGVWDPLALKKGITHRFSFVLRHALGIEELTLHSPVVDVELAKAVLNLPLLHTLKLMDTDWTIEDASVLPDSTSLLNLYITSSIIGVSHSSLALVLPRMPALRYLSNNGPLSISRLVIHEPPDALDACSTILRTVERMQISNIFPEEVDDILDWLIVTSAIKSVPLVITHFRLRQLNGLFDDQCREVVHALRDAPMQSFHLEGMQEAKPDFIDYIAALLPDLLELTLVYRESNRQVFMKASTWPYPAQEYAPRFTGFRRLKSFTFNFRLNHVVYSPVIMRSFEDGFESEIIEDDGPGVVSCEDWRCMFRMFATYIPTLETLDFINCTVFRRREGGSIDVEVYSGHNPFFVDTERCSTPLRPWENLPTFVPYRSPRFTALSSV